MLAYLFLRFCKDTPYFEDAIIIYLLLMRIKG
jgi:hypothetical protein